MAKIDIRRKHSRSLKAAKSAVDKTAKAIGKKFAIVSEWEGDTLHFERGGVNGHIRVTHTEVHVFADLGFLLGMMRAAIEEEIERQLDEQFK